MSDLFRDQIWTFVNAAFAGIAVLIPVSFYFLQKRIKSLRYKVLWQLPLVIVHDELINDGQLTISFNGKPVKDIHLVLIEIVNTGNVPITSGDYERPLSIRYGNDSTVLSAEVVNEFPVDLDPFLSVSKNAIDIKPLLLNPGDGFVVKSIVRDFQKDVVLDGRVIGVDRIKHIGSKPKQRTGTYYAVLGLGIVLGSMFIPKFEIKIIELVFASSVFRGSVLLFGAVLYFYGLMPVRFWQDFLDKRKSPNKIRIRTESKAQF